MADYSRHVFPAIRTLMAVVLLTFCPTFALRGQSEETAISGSVIMFKIADGFALRQFGVRVAPDSVLRGGTAVASSPLSAWISGDYGEDNDRNFLEGGVSTQFILRKNSRYPMIVKIPISTAFGEEEYFFGRHFGHASTGVNVRVPLSFISTRYGRWTAGTSAELCYYGTTMAEFVGSIGLQLPRIGAVLSVEL